MKSVADFGVIALALVGWWLFLAPVFVLFGWYVPARALLIGILAVLLLLAAATGGQRLARTCRSRRGNGGAA